MFRQFMILLFISKSKNKIKQVICNFLFEKKCKVNLLFIRTEVSTLNVLWAFPLLHFSFYEWIMVILKLNWGRKFY